MKTTLFITGLIVILGGTIGLMTTQGPIPTKSDFVAAFQIAPNCDGTKTPTNGGCKLEDFYIFLNNLFKVMIKLTFIVAPILIAWGGIKMIYSGGNSSTYSAGWQMIRTAIWGIVIALLSYIILWTVIFVLTGFHTPTFFQSESFNLGSPL